MNLQTQVLKGQTGSNQNLDPLAATQGFNPMELPAKRLSENLSNSLFTLAANTESAYLRIQEHIDRTVYELGDCSRSMQQNLTSTADTIQDLNYSGDMLSTLEEAERALNAARTCCNFAAERAELLRAEQRQRADTGPRVVYSRERERAGTG